MASEKMSACTVYAARGAGEATSGAIYRTVPQLAVSSSFAGPGDDSSGFSSGRSCRSGGRNCSGESDGADCCRSVRPLTRGLTAHGGRGSGGRGSGAGAGGRMLELMPKSPAF